jgi:quinoprotein glucose dehydrogenase
VLALACDGGGPAPAPPADAPATTWPHYGNDAGGSRHSPLADIDAGNVERLRVAWTYHHGDVFEEPEPGRSTTVFEATPILVDETLFFCTPFNRVIALDPETGEERWSFDPELDLDVEYANELTCRGVSTWLDAQAAAGATCRRRIFTATNDRRLIALDAASGRRCAEFGRDGELSLDEGVGELAWPGEYQVTSPPAIAGDLVIVGSAISDNQRVLPPSGVVRAYDARTGALRWAWDLRPPGFVETPENTGPTGFALGTPNVWAPMAVDEARDLLFVPTGNPSPDYFRGDSRLDHFGSSVVALRASTGRVVWRFQTVHRDLWDFDVPAQPTLTTVRRDGREIPAVVQGTKAGFLFVLHRETGEPLFPVEERPVPQGGVADERLSPTQPFPSRPPPLVRQSLAPEEAWGLTPWDRGACRERLEALAFDGIFTPPTLQGTLMVPGNAGGVNWGGVAADAERGVVVVNVQDYPWAVTLLPAADFERERAANPGVEISAQKGTPYAMRRELVFSPLGLPCSPPPWGSLAAVDLASGELRWQVPLGSVRDIAPVPLPVTLGVPNLGGPLVTASGLVFIGAALEKAIRAFDVETGDELWQARLPASAQATPMTYRARRGGRQYLVIGAGGYGRAGVGMMGDAIVAFALE